MSEPVHLPDSREASHRREAIDLPGRSARWQHRDLDETSDVNRLTAQNHADDVHVFIQSGDIVKGGRQDRTLAQDVILPPRSQKIDLDSFCVEQGRWQKRGNENEAQFSSSKKRLSSKQLKLAAKKAKSQQAVWNAVATEQDRLGRNVGKSVRNSESATSLQLSLEDKAVEKKNREYQKDLLPIARQAKDVVGFAFAINGAFNSADIYGDPDLFQQLWPGLLESAACEALALSDRQTAQASVDARAVRAHILEALKGNKTKGVSSKATQRTSGETKTNHTFETRDAKNQMIHLNIIQKDR